MLTLLKYSTHDCSICRATAVYDSKIAAEMGLKFVNVDLKNPEIYRRFRSVLLKQYPLKKELMLPTYILVENPEGDFEIHGEISGGPTEGMFRSLLEELIRGPRQDKRNG